MRIWTFGGSGKTNPIQSQTKPISNPATLGKIGDNRMSESKSIRRISVMLCGLILGSVANARQDAR